MEAADSLPSVSQVYLFLGKCFSYPTQEFYQLTQDEGTGAEVRVMVEALPFAVNFKGIPTPGLPQEEFESEYIGTFDIAFGPSHPCPLHESDYRDDVSSTEITEELLRFYEHFQVKLSDKERDYPDHLVVELEFVAYLAKKEADAGKRGNDPAPYCRAQVDFLERHLDKWVPKLDEKIQKSIKQSFYQGASSFLREFLSSHLSYLRKNVSYPAGTAKS
ncbi:MAG: hypothetical protein A2253_07905 [Deltaproteobacteria bacterium RIFOXYA2_FULL_55_11]|nr:MAG: hypothetical protein A2253_07905 [Deltaproteobacteria bacterium RIFOXYA2_FULL_55_11]